MKHVVLVTVDALKNALVGSDCAAGTSTTPRIDSFFSGGARFHRAFAASFPTQFAMPGLMLGDLPLDGGGYHLGVTARGTTLAERFKARGYRTVALTTDYHTSACYGYSRGFDLYLDLHDPAWHANAVKRNDLDFLSAKGALFGIPDAERDRLAAAKLSAYLPFLPRFLRRREAEIRDGRVGGPQIDNWRFEALAGMADSEAAAFAEDPSAYLRRVQAGDSAWFATLPNLRVGPHYPDADDVLERALEHVRPGEEPLFLWVHLTDVHGTLTEDLAGLRPPSDADGALRRDATLGSPFGRLPQRYPGQGERSDWRAVRFLDACVGDFLMRVEARLGSDAFVAALSADHGDHRAERYGYGACDGISDHLNLFDELMHIPLLFRGPGCSGDYGDLVSILDIGSILLSLSSGADVATCARARKRDCVVSEHAYPGSCAIPYKPLKIAVRSTEAKVVWFDPPDDRFGPARVVQAYDLVADPLEKTNLAHEVGRIPKLAALAQAASRRAADVRRANPRPPGS